ncbi:MAG: hypothetical protein EA355_12750 [Rhodobacteraceae bacterium]|nr:MAG: hypothetical protein EA355_12750 [Paracoccaceae bacterium]
MARLDWWMLAVLTTLTLVSVVSQTAFQRGMSNDEAQLVVWSQQARWWARDQPSLLSNAAALADWAGIDPLTFIRVARPIFVNGAVLIFWAALREAGWRTEMAWIGATAVLLVTDMHRMALVANTHTPFMAFGIACAFLAATQAVTRPSWASYGALGVALALLPHTKFNAGALFFCLLLTAAIDPTARRLVQDRRFRLAAGVFAASAAMLAALALGNRELVEAESAKYAFGASPREVSIAFAGGALGALRAAILAAAILLALGLRFRGDGLIAEERATIRSTMTCAVVFFVLAGVVALATSAGVVRWRWLMPGTLFAGMSMVALAASRLAPRARVATLAAICVFWTAVTGRHAIDALAHHPDRDHTALIAELAQALEPGDVVVGPRVIVAAAVLGVPGVTGWIGETGPAPADRRIVAVWPAAEAPPAIVLAAVGDSAVRNARTLDLGPEGGRYAKAIRLADD